MENGSNAEFHLAASEQLKTAHNPLFHNILPGPTDTRSSQPKENKDFTRKREKKVAPIPVFNALAIFAFCSPKIGQ